MMYVLVCVLLCVVTLCVFYLYKAWLSFTRVYMCLLIMQHQSSAVGMVLNAKLFPKFEGNCIVIIICNLY